MSRKVKITGEEKAEIARRVATGELGVREAAREVGVDHARIREWKNRYEAQGALAFRETEENQVYSQETKKKAVEDYLGARGSLQIIAAKYGLRSESTLRAWIKQLEHELYMTKMERDLLKKLDEIERRDAFRK